MRCNAAWLCYCTRWFSCHERLPLMYYLIQKAMTNRASLSEAVLPTLFASCHLQNPSTQPREHTKSFSVWGTKINQHNQQEAKLTLINLGTEDFPELWTNETNSTLMHFKCKFLKQSHHKIHECAQGWVQNFQLNEHVTQCPFVALRVKNILQLPFKRHVKHLFFFLSKHATYQAFGTPQKHDKINNLRAFC